MKRLKYASQMFWYAFRKPEFFQVGVFALIESMMKFLNDTQEANHPMTSDIKLGIINTNQLKKLDEDSKSIVQAMTDKPLLHLWCGIGAKDSPILRVRELMQDKAALESQVLRLTFLLDAERSERQL